MRPETNRFGIDPGIWDDIQKILSKYPITKAVLFGSRARGDYKSTSDIDIAIWWSDDQGRGLLAQELEDLPTIHKIDLVDFDSIENQAMKDNIVSDGLEIILSR